MPPLDHPRYEAFCQAIASGQSADKAYVTAGYKPNRGNAATLKANQNIKARVAEIVAERSNAVQKAIGYARRVVGLLFEAFSPQRSVLGSYALAAGAFPPSTSSMM